MIKNNKENNKKSITFYEELAKEVTQDFEQRRNDRLLLERQWELNLNFVAGKQYSSLNNSGEIIDDKKTYYWQNKEVFNHIAPIIETRLAKFSRISPAISVRPKSDDDGDVMGATVAEKLIESALGRADIKSTVNKVCMWSETCGTGFYKILWNNNGGEIVGEVDGNNIYEGDVEVNAISPFEIFPDNLFTEDIDDLNSIIHARAVTVKDVEKKYGVKLLGSNINIYDLSNKSISNVKDENNTVIKDAVIVIEKFERPSDDYPNGRIITVADNKLLYYSELPYLNAANHKRGFPFVKQVSQRKAGCFFGQSIVERLIPIQRSFNAVKNRKHEFLNRLSMGIMTVEDGSIDIDDLQEEGLTPGKVLVYRQGCKPPEIMDEMQIPPDFADEEDKLKNEFIIISGVSDVSSSSTNARITSGTGLELLVQQDSSRLVVAAENIRNCYLDVARQIIRLYAQFMASVRAIKTVNIENKPLIIYADKKTVNSDDVYIENENELLCSDQQKKDMIFKLFQSGLLTDKDGKIRNVTKEKILTMLGFKDLDYHKGVSRLHEKKAQTENEKIRKYGLDIEEIDNDEIHIDEHTRYILSEYDELSLEEKNRLFSHLSQHKKRIELNNKKQMEEI